MKTTKRSSGSNRSASHSTISSFCEAARRTRSRSNWPLVKGNLLSSSSDPYRRRSSSPTDAGKVRPCSRAAASNPAMAKPSTSGAGQVKGTLTMPRRRSDRPRWSQTAGARRKLPFTSRSWYPVSSRSVKSQIPCRPALTPVTIVDHACGVSGWVVDRSTPRAPSRQARPMFGSSPASSIGSTTSKVAESRPMRVKTGLDTRQGSRYKLETSVLNGLPMGMRQRESCRGEASQRCQ